MFTTLQINDFFDEKGLESYWAIVKTGRITDAAAMLDVTQPAVSAAVKKLENKLGKDLFKRRGYKRLTLTDEGKMLFLYADAYFSNQANKVFKKSDLVNDVVNIGISSLIRDIDKAALITKIHRYTQEVEPNFNVKWSIKSALEITQEYITGACQIIIVPVLDRDLSLCFNEEEEGQHLELSNVVNVYSDSKYSDEVYQRGFISKDNFSLLSNLPKPLSQVSTFENQFELISKLKRTDFLVATNEEHENYKRLGADVSTKVVESNSINFVLFNNSNSRGVEKHLL